MVRGGGSLHGKGIFGWFWGGGGILGSNCIKLKPNPESTMLFSSTWPCFYLKPNLPYRQEWRGKLIISRSVNLSVSLDMFLRDLC